MIHVRWLCIALVSLVAGCGEERSTNLSPTAPTPVVPAAPPPPQVTVIQGTITETLTGERVGNFTSETTSFPARVTVAAGGFLTRETFVSNATPTVDLIREGGEFSLDFYRQLVRNTKDAPGAMEPLRRQAQAPRFYIRTVDEGGGAMPDEALSEAAAVFSDDSIRSWTGGRFGSAGIEFGPGTHEGEAGWITVKWISPIAPGNLCGRAQIAGTWIELNFLNSNCTCHNRISRKTIRHEIGHAMGFWHTDSPTDLMWNFVTAGCDGRLSERELHHAAIAYTRSIGNRDIDVDTGPVTLRPLRPVVVVD